MKTLKIISLLALLTAAVPLLQAQTTESFSFTTNRMVPDGNASGLSDVRNVNSAIGTITSLKVRLKVAGEFNGDLYGYLRHANGFVVLLNRPGKTAADAYGYSDSGFNVTFQTGATNGDLHVYQNVITPADGSPLTGLWQPDGRNVDPANVTDLSSRSTSLTNFNTLNAAGGWTLYLVDLEAGATNMLTEWGLDITGSASPALAWSRPADIVYGTALSGTQLNATATYNATNVPGTLVYEAAAGTILNAGLTQTLSVTFIPTDTNSFLSVSTNVTINVSAAPLTITALDTSKVYGAGVPTLTAGYSGFVNGDTAASLSTPVTLGTMATMASAVGNYVITASGAVGANYTITQVNGNLTVTPALLTISAVNKSKVYGAALPALTATFTGFVNGDTTASLTTPVTLGTTATSASIVGNYTITASGAINANYTITQINGMLAVTPAPLTITAVDKSKIYGATLPILTASYSGFVNGDTVSSLTTPVTLGTAATTASAVGNYVITASGTGGANYTIIQVNGTLSITPASITVTADDQTKVFGAALLSLTANYSGFALGESSNELTALATIATTATATSDVGTYALVASGATSTNYTFNYVNGTLTIVQSQSSGVIVSTANPSLPGTNVTFRVTLGAVAPGVGIPSGAVNFRIDGTSAGSGNLSGGVALFTTNNLALGSHTVIAEFAGDLNFVGTTNSLTQDQIINTPPLAGNDTILRSPLTSAKVRLATLLANDSDADGDPLNISISSVSANNASITVRGEWVYYTPAVGFTNADSFTYTITDGRGASATAIVTVAIKVDNGLSQNLTLTDLGNGSFLIDGSGIPGYTYRLQYSDTIAPFIWQDIVGGTVTADDMGRFEYTDIPGTGMRFYRSVFP